jgi:hypothetical protein
MENEWFEKSQVSMMLQIHDIYNPHFVLQAATHCGTAPCHSTSPASNAP